jgi:hypothetical protein
MDLRFKQVSKDEELSKCLDVIRTSFLTVAEEFNLTIENAPTNPAFIGINHLVKMREKGIAMPYTIKTSKLVLSPSKKQRMIRIIWRNLLSYRSIDIEDSVK